MKTINSCLFLLFLMWFFYLGIPINISRITNNGVPNFQFNDNSLSKNYKNAFSFLILSCLERSTHYTGNAVNLWIYFFTSNRKSEN